MAVASSAHAVRETKKKKKKRAAVGGDRGKRRAPCTQLSRARSNLNGELIVAPPPERTGDGARGRGNSLHVVMSGCFTCRREVEHWFLR